jgi:hypothetical protein
MTADFIATADERNEIIIWSHINFSYMHTIKIPEVYDQDECMEFVISDPHKKFEGESKITELKFLREAGREHMLLVLENRGCIHIVNAKEAKVFQVHTVNIGQYAQFDLDYETMGTRLYSLDADLRITIFYKAEDVDIKTFREENLSPIPIIAGSPLASRKVTFAKTAEESTEGKDKHVIKLARLNSGNQTPSTVGKRRKAIANRHTDNDLNVKREKEASNSWAFYTIKTVDHPLEGIPVTFMMKLTV